MAIWAADGKEQEAEERAAQEHAQVDAHAMALLPRTGDIEGCRVTVSRALASNGDLAPYEVRVEVRRTGGEVLVDRASAAPIGVQGNDEDLVVQIITEVGRRARLAQLFDIILRDRRSAWRISPEGRSEQLMPDPDAPPDTPETMGTFATLMKLASGA